MIKLHHKFFNKPTHVDNIRFHSKAEAMRYAQLKMAKKAGDVIFFIRQVPFELPGKIKYLADFMVFWTDGNVTVEDVKGVETYEFKMKRKLLEETYPLTLTIIKAN